MTFHVPNLYRVRDGDLATEDAAGNNGLFVVPVFGGALRVLASDGMDWEHVSVSLHNRCPTWVEMCHVKARFWDEGDCVVQYHPPVADYVNCHPYCLHLWRPITAVLPCPPSYMVGPKGELVTA